MITLVAAMTPERVIGDKNALPWRISEDFAQYKAYTLGKPLIMGRKTFESIGRPLPNRRNIVVSRSAWSREWVEVVASIEEALDLVKGAPEVIINGGATLYEACLPLADKLRISHIHNSYPGDTYFPAFEHLFEEVSRVKYTDFDVVEYVPLKRSGSDWFDNHSNPRQ